MKKSKMNLTVTIALAASAFGLSACTHREKNPESVDPSSEINKESESAPECVYGPPIEIAGETQAIQDVYGPPVEE